RAWMRRRQGLTEAALSDLSAAVSLEPENVASIRQLGDWYIEARAWAAALAQYRALWRVLSDASTGEELTEVRLRMQALSLMAAETDPVSSGAHADDWVRRSIALLARN